MVREIEENKREMSLDNVNELLIENPTAGKELHNTMTGQGPHKG